MEHLAWQNSQSGSKGMDRPPFASRGLSHRRGLLMHFMNSWKKRNVILSSMKYGGHQFAHESDPDLIDLRIDDEKS